MSRHIQVTFDARDPRALSSFWRGFLARAGVPAEQRNTASAIEDPDGHGPRLFFQQVPEGKFLAA
jgi:glyoxalase superfamily protein